MSMTVTFRHYLALVFCYVLGVYAWLDSGNQFGGFAMIFVPVLCLLLTVGLVRGWIGVSWL